jgi:nucleoside-diphosphate-sugar epimerase
MTKRLREDLGFTPRFSIEDGLRDELKRKGPAA